MIAPLLLLALALQTVSQPAPASADPTVQPPPASAGSHAGSTASSRPDADGVYRHMGKDLTPPRVIRQVEPKFPKDVQGVKFSGSVVVGLIIDMNGNTTNVHIVRSLSGNPGTLDNAIALSLDQAALDAVSKYRFTPAKRDGNPIPVEVNVEVNFQRF